MSNRELDEARAENDHLRASLANGSGPCPYCNLPKEDWAKCQHGFPGCDRADDAMLCPHVGASLEAEAALAASKAEVERLTFERDFERLIVGKLGDEVDTLKTENERLREALEPFGDAWDACEAIGEQCCNYPADETQAWVGAKDGRGSTYPLFKFGDLRRARAALGGSYEV